MKIMFINQRRRISAGGHRKNSRKTFDYILQSAVAFSWETSIYNAPIRDCSYRENRFLKSQNLILSKVEVANFDENSEYELKNSTAATQSIIKAIFFEKTSLRS